MSEHVERPNVRRGPGRPPLTSLKPDVDRLGVCTTPSNVNNMIEFYSAVPSVFKKIYAQYKATNVREISMHFEADRVIMSAISYSEAISLQTVINCSKAHRYYCRSPVKIRLSYEQSEKIINRIDAKFFDGIWFIVKQSTVVNNMSIILKNSGLGATSNHTINLTSAQVPDPIQSWNESEYPLSFKLNRQTFKKYISDIEGISAVVTIQRLNNLPLKFMYASEGGIVTGSETFSDDAKIGLQMKSASSEAGDYLVATSVKISNIKPLSNAQIAEEVRVYVDNNKPMLICVDMEDSIRTVISIKIEDYRGDK